MIPDRISTLDDATAVRLLSAIAGPRLKLAPPSVPPTPDLRAALATSFGDSRSPNTASPSPNTSSPNTSSPAPNTHSPDTPSPPSPAATPGDVARAALLLATEDPTLARAVTILLDRAQHETFAPGKTVEVVTAVLALFGNTHLRLERTPAGWSFLLEKPPAPDGALLALARTLQSSLPDSPSPPFSPQHAFKEAPTMEPSSAATRMFIAHAPEDHAHATVLSRALAVWVQRGTLQLWTQDHMTPGAAAAATLQARFAASNVVVFLLSTDALASPVQNALVRLALARREAGTARVIPVLVRPCEWGQSELGSLSALPRNTLPVTEWPSPDAGWHSVTSGLAELL